MEKYRILFRSENELTKSNHLFTEVNNNSIEVVISTIKTGEKVDYKYVCLSRESAIRLVKELKRQIGKIN